MKSLTASALAGAPSQPMEFAHPFVYMASRPEGEDVQGFCNIVN